MLSTIIILLLAISLPATASADIYSEYIATYSGMAVEQQRQYGIPASITLAQGLLESSAGRSTLATEGNNHFGIKCHKEWSGKTMLRDDDAADECFRVYDSAAESYADHSRFLTRQRYEPPLRRYATDPNYADRLITIIERYSLYNFDTEAGRHIEETAEYIAETLRRIHPIRRSRGLHYVVALPGDTYASIAKEFSLNARKLMKYNDARHDSEIRPWEEVYLQEKLDEAPEGIASATIGQDESMHSISQRFGMKLKTLRALNRDIPDKAGQTLRLR